LDGFAGQAGQAGRIPRQARILALSGAQSLALANLNRAPKPDARFAATEDSRNFAGK